MQKKILLSLFVLMLGVFGYFYISIYPMLPVATGYAAKKMCSCHFIAGRNPESIQRDDLANSPLDLTKSLIDPVKKTVTSSFWGLGAKTAVFREHLGCVLLKEEDDYKVQLDLEPDNIAEGKVWPLGEKISDQKVQGVDYEALDKAIRSVFDSSLEMDKIKTRAVVVVYKDTLIAEKYANGFNKDTEILGWSMSKSITGTLIGILVRDGKLRLDQNQLFEDWTDERSKITVNDLLQMQSGLAFEEDYGKVSDVTEMLFMSEDIVKRATSNPLDTTIGSKWYYSSGTTNILSGLIRQQFESHNAYLRFPHERLFRKTDMHSMVLEIDESGNYIGSSFAYATPRDWAKLGLLYLNQGNWYGTQIVDTSWVEMVRQPAEHSKGRYGGHFWHNHNHVAFKDVPGDLFSCNGFEGQYVYIIPSRDLVVVRMGLNEGPEYDANNFLKTVIKAVGRQDKN